MGKTNLVEQALAIEDPDARAEIFDKLFELQEKLEEYIENYDEMMAQKKANMKIVE